MLLYRIFICSGVALATSLTDLTGASNAKTNIHDQYARITYCETSGSYVDTNLNHNDKFSAPRQLSYVCAWSTTSTGISGLRAQLKIYCSTRRLSFERGSFVRNSRSCESETVFWGICVSRLICSCAAQWMP